MHGLPRWHGLWQPGQWLHAVPARLFPPASFLVGSFSHTQPLSTLLVRDCINAGQAFVPVLQSWNLRRQARALLNGAMLEVRSGNLFPGRRPGLLRLWRGAVLGWWSCSMLYLQCRVDDGGGGVVNVHSLPRRLHSPPCIWSQHLLGLPRGYAEPHVHGDMCARDRSTRCSLSRRRIRVIYVFRRVQHVLQSTPVPSGRVDRFTRLFALWYCPVACRKPGLQHTCLPQGGEWGSGQGVLCL